MKHLPSELGLSTGTLPGLAIRTLAPGDAAEASRWDAYVGGCPGATFFHRSGWQLLIEDVFRHRTHFLYAERAGRIEGVLPLAHVRSLLFGNALLSLPFAVYGGVVADTVEAATALEDAAQALARRLGVDHLEFRNVDGAPSGLADAGSLRHVPQGDPRRRRGQPAGDPAQATCDGAQGHQERIAQRDRCGAGSLLCAVRRQCPPARHSGAAAALLRGAAAGVRRGLRSRSPSSTRTGGRSAAC